MFDDKSLKTLEYDKILDMLASFAQAEGGKQLARDLRPFENVEDARHALQETEEADRILFEIGRAHV